MSAFSLPTQRCFPVVLTAESELPLFSAYAEVFPPGRPISFLDTPFLCLRRGVSITSPSATPASPFSLPTQRCFSRRTKRRSESLLFSAYAEVFLDQLALGGGLATFLCLRRGVSMKYQ